MLKFSKIFSKKEKKQGGKKVEIIDGFHWLHLVVVLLVSKVWLKVKDTVKRMTTTVLCMCTRVSRGRPRWQAGKKRWAKRTGSCKGEFWLQRSDGRTNHAQSYCRCGSKGVGYTPGHKGLTNTHTQTPSSPKGCAGVCLQLLASN